YFCSCSRRHTSFSRDWSSDVCSSDLPRNGACALASSQDSAVSKTIRAVETAPAVTLLSRNGNSHGRVRETELTTSRMLTTVEVRSEEHTSELQSRENLVCRLLLEKKS